MVPCVDLSGKNETLPNGIKFGDGYVSLNTCLQCRKNAGHDPKSQTIKCKRDNEIMTIAYKK